MPRELDIKKPQLWFGISCGLTAALILTAIVLLTRLGGATDSTLPPGITLLEQVALFFGGGLTGGVVLGMLFPFCRSRIGSAIVGMLAVTPFFLGQFWLMNVPRDQYQLLGMVIGIVGIGGSVGFWAGGKFKLDESESPT